MKFFSWGSGFVCFLDVGWRRKVRVLLRRAGGIGGDVSSEESIGEGLG